MTTYFMDMYLSRFSMGGGGAEWLFLTSKSWRRVIIVYLGLYRRYERRLIVIGSQSHTIKFPTGVRTICKRDKMKRRLAIRATITPTVAHSTTQPIDKPRQIGDSDGEKNCIIGVVNDVTRPQTDAYPIF